MNGRQPKSTPPISSPLALRAIVAGITFTTFTGMSAFAATHIQNPAAPLQPPADGTTSSAVATPAPAPAVRTRSTNTGTVPTTTAAPRTRTRRS